MPILAAPNTRSRSRSASHLVPTSFLSTGSGEVIGGRQWHKLPTWYIAAVEVILAKVKKAEEAGLWKVELDKDFLKDMLKYPPSKELRNAMGKQGVAKSKAIYHKRFG
ncbi:hypothetical protein AC579_2083 [Pseudocercospora musae]|uniref:Uncharacterized protein n=1 Tax=Pseudocercospora musae TaxID=113226 RepID=A0A139I5P6_9PEZI|nr:hypothetical protein AC579_2083 [Pseudocercospora musae]